jgi:WD40 repeat protein
VDLWRKYNNGDNLLFRKSDFESPDRSELLHVLWTSSGPELQSWAGLIAVAATSPFDQTPLLEDRLVDGRLTALPADEMELAREILGPPTTAANSGGRSQSEPAGNWWEQQQSEDVRIEESGLEEEDLEEIFEDDEDLFEPAAELPRLPLRRKAAVAPVEVSTGVNVDRLFLAIAGSIVAVVVFVGFIAMVATRRNPRPQSTQVATIPNPTPAVAPVEFMNCRQMIRDDLPYYHVAFSPTSDRLFTSGATGAAVLDAQTLTQIRKQPGYCTAVSVAQTANRVALDFSGTIQIWDLELQQKLQTINGNSGTRSLLALAPDGQHLAMTSGYRSRITNLQGTRDSLSAAGELCSISGNGKRATFADLSVYDIESERRICQFVLPQAAATGSTSKGVSAPLTILKCVQLSSDGSQLAFGTRDGRLFIGNVATGKTVHSINAHSKDVASLTFSPDGRLLVSGSWDRLIKFWDVLTGNHLQTITEHADLVYCVAFSPDGKSLASASADKTVRVWGATPTFANEPPTSSPPQQSPNPNEPTTNVAAAVADDSPVTYKNPSNVPLSKASFPKTYTSPSTKMTFECVPAAEYWQGADATNVAISDTEKPKHQVRLSQPFYLGRVEVTQGEYQQIIGRAPSRSSTVPDDKLAVESVTWYDALECCNRLSQQDGLPLYYGLSNIIRHADGSISSASVRLLRGDGYRLPTESEWEYAAESDAATAGNEPAGTAAGQVGRFSPNRLGLYDLHGNVSEWCVDTYFANAYSRLPGTMVVDPLFFESNPAEVALRGRNWYISSARNRLTLREHSRPGQTSTQVGFRMARTPVAGSEVGTLADPVADPATPATVAEPTLIRVMATSNSCLSFAVDGTEKRALTGARDGGLQLWNLDDGTLVSTIGNLNAPLASVAISRNASVGLACAVEGNAVVHVFDLQKSKSMGILTQQPYVLGMSAAFDEKNSGIVVAGDSLTEFRPKGRLSIGTARWLDEANWSRGLLDQIRTNGQSPCVATPVGSGGLYFRASDDQYQIRHFAPENKWDLLVFSPARQAVLEPAFDKKAELGRLRGHSQSIVSMAISGSGLRMISRDSSGIVISWDLRTQQEISRWDTQNPGVPRRDAFALSPDGSLAAMHNAKGELEVWDVNTQKRLHVIPQKPSNQTFAAAFLGSRGRLLVGSDAGLQEWQIPVPATAVAATQEVPPQVSAPTLKSPAHRGQLPGNTPRGQKNTSTWDFDWDDVPGATNYHLFVKHPDALNPVLDNTTLKKSDYKHPILDVGLQMGWEWRVRAMVDGKWTDWSETRVFNAIKR